MLGLARCQASPAGSLWGPVIGRKILDRSGGLLARNGVENSPSTATAAGQHTLPSARCHPMQSFPSKQAKHKTKQCAANKNGAFSGTVSQDHAEKESIVMSTSIHCTSAAAPLSDSNNALASQLCLNGTDVLRPTVVLQWCRIVNQTTIQSVCEQYPQQQGAFANMYLPLDEGAGAPSCDPVVQSLLLLSPEPVLQAPPSQKSARHPPGHETDKCPPQTWTHSL